MVPPRKSKSLEHLWSSCASVLVTSVSCTRCDASHDFQSVPCGDNRDRDTVQSRATACLPDPLGKERRGRGSGHCWGPAWTPAHRAPASDDAAQTRLLSHPGRQKIYPVFFMLAELALFVYFNFFYLFRFTYSTNSSANSFYTTLFYSHHLRG